MSAFTPSMRELAFTIAVVLFGLITSCSSGNGAGADDGGGRGGAGDARDGGGDMRTDDSGAVVGCQREPSVSCNANTVGFRCDQKTSPTGVSACAGTSTFGPDNTIDSCCTLTASASCERDQAVACGPDLVGYSCSGVDTPAQSNGTLVCHHGMPVGAKTSYCCLEFTALTCSLFPGIGACGSDRYGFSCSNNGRPETTDRYLSCGMGTQSLNDTTLFCCDVRATPPDPTTCMVDPTVTCTPTTGYTCTAAVSPSDIDHTLVCGAPSSSGTTTRYCCRPGP